MKDIKVLDFKSWSINEQNDLTDEQIHEISLSILDRAKHLESILDRKDHFMNLIKKLKDGSIDPNGTHIAKLSRKWDGNPESVEEWMELTLMDGISKVRERLIAHNEIDESDATIDAHEALDRAETNVRRMMQSIKNS